jgi:hypothetical protein
VNKIQKFERRKIKEDNRKTKKVIPSKIEKFSKLQTLCREELFAQMLLEFGESEEAVKKFHGVNLSIYRGEGGSFKKLPRYDRCEQSGGRVSTPTFRG